MTENQVILEIINLKFSEIFKYKFYNNLKYYLIYNKNFVKLF